MLINMAAGAQEKSLRIRVHDSASEAGKTGPVEDLQGAGA
jgi:hypothetical protein